MTKRKPDKVIEYRISLQDKEKQIFEDLTTAYSIRNVGQGVGAILNPIATVLSNPESLLISIPILYALFYPRQDMEGADPLLFHALTGPPGDLFNNLSLWYMSKRKQAIESETPEDRERWEAMEELIIYQLPIIGPIFRLFR